MVDTDIILAKLKMLESVDSSIRHNLHGASEHEYRMNATVPLVEIEQWERQLHVPLPAEFRRPLSISGDDA